MSTRRRHEAAAEDDGVVSVILALSLVMFLSFLAVVVDLGQLYAARVLLGQGTTAAVADAGEILAGGGCAAFDAAKTAAADILTSNAPGATLETFEVTYGAVTVDDAVDCALVVTDQNTARVDVSTKDARAPVFAGFFTTKQGDVTAAGAAEWGYVAGLSGKVRPLSLCSQNAAYQDYLTYRTQLAAHLAAPLVDPAPDPAVLLAPFDIEADAFGGSPCTDAYGSVGVFGEFVNTDHTNAAGTQALLAGWVTNGVPYNLLLADPADPFPAAWCGDGSSNSAGACEGVSQTDSLDEVAHYLDVLDKTFPIMIHTTPECHNGHGASHCDGNGAREHRAYPLVAFARVKLLCLRITAATDAESPTSGSDCAGLSRIAVDGSPLDDVMMRLQFVVGETIQEGNLTSSASLDSGFLGLSVCSVDGDDNCGY